MSKEEIEKAKKITKNYIKDTPVAPYECLMNEERKAAIVLLEYIEQLEKELETYKDIKSISNTKMTELTQIKDIDKLKSGNWILQNKLNKYESKEKKLIEKLEEDIREETGYAKWVDSNTKRNAANIARGKDGSTLLGRMGSSAQRLAFGQDSYEKESAALGLAKARENAAKDLFGYLEGKGKTDGADYSVSTKVSDGFIVNDSVNGFNKKIAKAKADMQSGR